jgi:DNA-nicking Smr family endonuclease
MAKKKTSKQNASSPQEFSSSPFKNLKGLSAFAAQKTQPQSGASKPAALDVNDSAASLNGYESFVKEMDSLGVKPLSEHVVQRPVSVQEPEIQRPQLPAISREERETAAFLDAVGSVEKSFKDEWPEESAPDRQAVPRRMKQVERGQLKPEASLDLHGLTVEEASAKVRFFLQDVSYRGFQTILIITGKGLHSSDGPVLRQAVEKLLDQQREQVIEWGIAPRRYGGDGALIVFMRRGAAG